MIHLRSSYDTLQKKCTLLFPLDIKELLKKDGQIPNLESELYEEEKCIKIKEEQYAVPNRKQLKYQNERPTYQILSLRKYLVNYIHT